MEITSAALATALSVSISAIITIWYNRRAYQRNLDEQLDLILKLAFEYPQMENEEFIATWDPTKSSSLEEFIRYDLYCTLLFNFLSRLSAFYKYEIVSIEKHVSIRDWVRIHRGYWNKPLHTYENSEAYDPKFVRLINDLLR